MVSHIKLNASSRTEKSHKFARLTFLRLSQINVVFRCGMRRSVLCETPILQN